MMAHIYISIVCPVTGVWLFDIRHDMDYSDGSSMARGVAQMSIDTMYSYGIIGCALLVAILIGAMGDFPEYAMALKYSAVVFAVGVVFLSLERYRRMREATKGTRELANSGFHGER